jgi:hypothetical protein
MATVWVRIVILTVRITLSVCPFNRMAHTANNSPIISHPKAFNLFQMHHVSKGMSQQALLILAQYQYISDHYMEISS